MTVNSAEINAFVGMKLRARRVQIGMSQSALGEALGVTFQQVQKYEKGANRISASTLFRIAEHIKVPVAYFFEDCETMEDDAPFGSQDDVGTADLLRYLGDRDVVRLLEHFSHIRDSKRRYRVVALVKSIAGSE